MKNKEFRNSKIAVKAYDFAVLGITFCAACSMLSIQVSNDILLLAVVYSCIIMTSVSIGKYLISLSFSSLSTVLKLMLNNVSGLMIGASFMLILGLFIPGLSDFSLIIIVASVMAFFVFGTLSPLIKLDMRTHP